MRWLLASTAHLARYWATRPPQKFLQLILCKVFGLRLEFRRRIVSKIPLFETLPCFLYFPGQGGYRLVLKRISKSKYQYLANAMSFDTNRVCQSWNRRKSFSKQKSLL